jgi:hypothetical protein
MLDRLLAAGRERRQASEAVANAATRLSSLASTYASSFETERQAVENQRRRMGIAIPSLSQVAQRELTRIMAMVKQNRQLSEEMIAGLDPKIRDEFATVSTALDARFGRGAVLRNDNDLVSLVPPEIRKTFGAVRDNFKILQQIARLDENQRIISERKARVAGQTRTMER